MVNFNEIIKNKTILHIPIYSMFDRKTRKLNMSCDGNVNRYLTTYYLNNTYKKLSLYIPNKNNIINEDKFNEYILLLNNVKLYRTSYIKESALYQREKEFANKIINNIKNKNVDYIIFEGQQLGIKLLKTNGLKSKLIYWCPVCATNTKTRSFLNKDKEINEYIFKHKNISYIIVDSIDQYEYLKELGIPENKICLITNHIDRTLPMFSEYIKDMTIVSFIEYLNKENKKIIYLPFRLSDEGYKLEEIFNIINVYLNNNEYCILYPNLNNISVEELTKIIHKKYENLDVNKILNNSYKISSSRDTFYTILDNCKEIIIPYFEDINFINHSTIQELFNENKFPICAVVTNEKEFIECLKKH